MEYIFPKAFVEVQAEVLSNKLVNTIEIPVGSNVPNAFKDTTYIGMREYAKKG
ncbi:hypothetical protein [Sphaerochaeta halotolerans]|uniref:hypothetical protein n=1 Tax=Sphaerochaeta halotolerans TaxID=2293840 RepID=UPI0014033510|nr:hypothetical protein [Sphaerochaeta halotolerans]